MGRRQQVGPRTVAERMAVAREFFRRWPGAGRVAPGLGTALIGFMEWEISSGRLADESGSQWWWTVNGALVDHLAAVLDGAENHWSPYVVADEESAQAAFWCAHQESLRRGVELAREFLDEEPHTERRFIRFALAVVERSAATLTRTDDRALAHKTAELYPNVYPCPREHLDALLALAARAREPQAASASESSDTVSRLGQRSPAP